MLLLICLVVLFSSFGGILLAQSLKGLLIFKQGLEAGQRTMLGIGVAAVIAALLLSFAGLFFSRS